MTHVTGAVIRNWILLFVETGPLRLEKYNDIKDTDKEPITEMVITFEEV